MKLRLLTEADTGRKVYVDLEKIVLMRRNEDDTSTELLLIGADVNYDVEEQCEAILLMTLSKEDFK